MQLPRFARIANRMIGRVEEATPLDGPSHALETFLSRPAQLAGRPSEKVSNALHGTNWGHPVHPMLVTIPLGTWTFAFGLDLLAISGLLRSPKTEQTADAALRAGSGGRSRLPLPDWLTGNIPMVEIGG